MLGFIENREVESAFKDVITCLPKGSRAYLVGGTMRNAMYFKEHGKKLSQRDFDVAYVSSNFLAFKKKLLAKGFSIGNFDTTQQFTVKREYKEAVPKGQYKFIVFDISKASAGFQKKMNKVDFTIGGFSLPLRKVLNDGWYQRVKSLPKSGSDIRMKQLRLHRVGERSVFRCIRFMHMGFKAPSKREVDLIQKAYQKIDAEVLERNIVKLQDLVPVNKIFSIAKQLKLDQDFLQKIQK